MIIYLKSIVLENGSFALKNELQIYCYETKSNNITDQLKECYKDCKVHSINENEQTAIIEINP